MRSFFNKPSWASTGKDSGSDSEFYRRSGQTYNDIIAINKNARERRAWAQSSPQKRQHVSDTAKEGGSEDTDTEEQKVPKRRTPSHSSPPRLTVQDDTSPDSLSSVCRHSVVDDKSPLMAMDREVSTSPPVREGESPQLVSAAAPIQSPFTDATSKDEPKEHSTCPSQITDTSAQADTSGSDRNSTLDNTVVQILITSKIANTRPLIIHRKMSQSLKGVRLAWCIHQNLPKELHPTVILTWKGRRLFDVTTCRSLNINAHSAFSKDTSSFGDIFGEAQDIRIHMEAVTEETFTAAYQPSTGMFGSGSTPPASTEPQDTDQETRSEIVLKCPGLDDFRLRVTPKTHVSHVVTAFREARGISTEFKVCLAFDGDRLDPQSCLEDSEMHDGDLIDVLVKRLV
ncbi:ubiquitin-2 like Rad60 SUMO-like-domain-containing protein [Aspergillus carlsbadensis]|nr:ubiquitin-2 like Rad60 SUMO-like-domain-containing protein [Aspergillus carlsbadensis]